MIGNGLNVHQEKFRIAIRKNFIEWVVRSLEELRGFLDVAFGDMVISEVFSSLNYSVIYGRGIKGRETMAGLMPKAKSSSWLKLF